MAGQAARCCTGAVLRPYCPELWERGRGGDGVQGRELCGRERSSLFLITDMVTRPSLVAEGTGWDSSSSCAWSPGMQAQVRLWRRREAPCGNMAPASHLSPLLCSQGMDAAWQGAGGLRLPTVAGESFLWWTHRVEPGLFHPPALESPGFLLKCRCRVRRSG